MRSDILKQIPLLEAAFDAPATIIEEGNIAFRRDDFVFRIFSTYHTVLCHIHLRGREENQIMPCFYYYADNARSDFIDTDSPQYRPPLFKALYCLQTDPDCVFDTDFEFPLSAHEKLDAYQEYLARKHCRQGTARREGDLSE